MKSSNIYRLDTTTWSVERIVFLVAGIFVAVSTLLGMSIDFRFLWFTLFVGGMLIFFAITGYCPMAILVDRILNKKNGIE